MNREEVISILKYDNAMATFNPMTGEVIESKDLREDEKKLYEAHQYCIDLLISMRKEDTYEN